MIEFQQAAKKDEVNLSELVELRRRVAKAREKLEQSVETARIWKGVKKADTLIFGVSTLVLGGAFAGTLAGSNALAETHHIWSVVLASASFFSLLTGGATLALTATRAIGISLANTDLEVAEAKLAAFDATPVNELELKEAPTE